MSEISETLSTANPWFYYPFILGLILAVGIAGQRLGQHFHDPDAHPRIITHLDSVQAALIGLLSLMIAFTFSLSLSRYDARRIAVLDEATAISESRELAALLPPPQAAAASRLLAAYTATRIELGVDAANLPQRRVIIARSNALHRALWEQAIAAGAGSAQTPRTPTILFVNSLISLDDRDEERLAADHNQVPLAVFLGLYGLALLASGYSGFTMGVKGSRGLRSNLVLGAAIATVITLIADLDTPGSGLVVLNQDPLIGLQQTAPPIP